VRVSDRIAHIDEPLQQTLESQGLFTGVTLDGSKPMVLMDGIVKAFTPDKPHGEKRPTFGIVTDPINRNNTWVFQACT
jgi:hypothetical protein